MKNIFLSFCTLLAISAGINAQDITFPRELTNEGSILLIYQPQVDAWKDYKKLVYRAAISLTPFQGNEVIGVIYMESTTDVNNEKHQVLIHDMIIQKSHFPSLEPDSAALMGALVKTFLSTDRSLLMSLEQIVACTPKTDNVPAVSVNNDPPVFFVSKKPTILIQTEGEPVLYAANKENLKFVVNTNYPMFYDSFESMYYLYDGLEWQQGAQINGPYKFTKQLPKTLINLAKDTNWVFLKELIPPKSKPDNDVPQVYFSTQPAELIVFEGEPDFKLIEETNLSFATNTQSDFFFCKDDNHYYVVTSGRWFRSSNLNGPWTYASQDLPKDFLNIPITSPASAILPFVAGSEQAKDAVMIAQIPTTIVVNAEEAAKNITITYAGEPKFEPIDSTDLYYAVNTSDKVIKVSDDSFYACVKGIWFKSESPNGPWETATSVPEVIYNMPSSSPVYNVTYVTQNVTNENTVEASYTSGYMGVYVVPVATTVVIISGTGYYHPPYYYYPPYGYPYYYHYPMTYGPYAYHPYHYGGVAYHASYNSNTGMYSRGATAYGPYGSASVGQGYNPYTGTHARGASVSTPYGSRSAAQAYNPYTGTAASTRQGSSPYAQWGTSTVSRNGQSASAAHISTPKGTAVKTSNGDLFATSNGNVYKKSGNGWESTSNARSNATVNQPSTQNMNRESQNRQRGSTQTQQFQSRSSSSSSYTRPAPSQSRGRRG